MKKRLYAVSMIVALLICMVTSASAKTVIKSKGVVINASSVKLQVGNIATLTAIMNPVNSTDTLSWSSSNTSVAKVNKYGVVTAISPGKAKITVKTSRKKTAKCSVTVKSEMTKAEIEELVKSNLLSEDSIKKLIADNTLSEEAVKNIVKENTLTEEDVKALIAKEKQSSWSDNAIVSLISGQTFPMLISDPNKTNIVGNITSMKVTKRRVTSSFYDEGVSVYLPYRYDILLTANVPAITEAQKKEYIVGISLGAPNVAADFGQIKNYTAASFVNSTMTELVTIYSAYDVDEYFVGSSLWESKP